MCAVHKRGFGGLVFMTYGWFGGPWWKKGLDNLDCTAGDMEYQAQGSLMTNAHLNSGNVERPRGCRLGNPQRAHRLAPRFPFNPRRF